MLETREYTRKELAAELHISESTQQLTDCIQKKMDRWGIEYTHNNKNGDNRIFNILSLPDRFNLYCMDKFNCASNTHFQKMREVFYFTLNDDNFLAIPDTEKEQFFAERNLTISRGTIKNYIKKLINADFLGGGNYVYLVVSKDSKGRHISSPITKERYNAGWKIYWSVREETKGDYMAAYADLYDYLGGHPLKRLVPEENAIMLDEIEVLQQIIAESYERDLQI